MNTREDPFFLNFLRFRVFLDFFEKKKISSVLFFAADGKILCVYSHTARAS